MGSRSDEQTILSTLTIKSIHSKAKVFAYIVDRENLSHIRKARADEVMVSDAYAGYLMASHILSPGVPQMVDQLCSEEGLFNLSRLEIPPGLHGKTYGELTEIVKEDYNAFALGLGREEEGMDIRNILSDDYSYLDQFIKRKFEKAGRGIGEESRINIRINPPSDTPIDENDFLIAITEGGNN
jgi:voltage-gated potassium channel